MNEETFVIVGAGLAGAKAAETLREDGFGGRVVLVGSEHELPYERPPLSKQYLAGEAERDSAHVHPREFYDEQRIELIAGVAATELDTAAHRVGLADGRTPELRAGADRHRRDPAPPADRSGSTARARSARCPTPMPCARRSAPAARSP